MCGSCWAFSAVGALEGGWKLLGSNNKLYNLSAQQLVDCSEPQGNGGCLGGLMDWAFNYTMQYGSCEWENYPYAAKTEECKAFKCKNVINTTGCVNLWTGNISTTEDLLEEFAGYNPVSVAVSAGNMIWMSYGGGIIDDLECYDEVDHGVLVVGYNTSESGVKYWIVKNSWGADWGVSGYIHIARGNNICGIGTDPSLPTF